MASDPVVTVYVKQTSDWRRFFTLTYWWMQLSFIMHFGRPLNIVSTFTITIPDKSVDVVALVSDVPDVQKDG